MRTSLHLIRALALSAVLACGPGAAAQTSQRITAGKASEYGLIYTLPATVADIHLQAELTEEIPGEFHNYARRYLGMTDAITAPGRRATLTAAVVVPRGVADSSQQWLAQFKNGNTVSMGVTPDNLPLNINTEKEYAPAAPALPEASDWSASPLEGPAASQAVTADMARSSSTAKRAELAAQRIFELREMRSDILSGQADNMPSDGTAMQLVLDNLGAQEAALTAMFAGVRRTRKVTTMATVVPDSTATQGRVVARLSVTDGFVDASDLAGEPVTVDIEPVERGELPVNDKGEVKTFPRGGVAYCVPGRARLTVSFRDSPVATTSFAVAQLGVVFGLNPAMFSDKREPSMAVFDPTCGAMVEIGPVQ